MFIGTYSHSVDDKGRLIIPARFRASLGKGLHITTGIDNCLVIYNDADWEKLAGEINELPMTKRSARYLKRHFIGNSEEIDVDKQGRIVIPENLRTLAGIDKEAVLIGIGEQIEVWDRDAWLVASDSVSTSDIEAGLEELNI